MGSNNPKTLSNHFCIENENKFVQYLDSNPAIVSPAPSSDDPPGEAIQAKARGGPWGGLEAQAAGYTEVSPLKIGNRQHFRRPYFINIFQRVDLP